MGQQKHDNLKNNHAPRKRTAGKIAAWAGITALAAAAVSGWVEFVSRAASNPTSKLVRREENKKEAAYPRENGAVYREAKDWLYAQSSQTVSILSHDGLKLCGHWFESPDAKRTLVLVHGWHSHWYKDFGPFARFFRSCGCNMLLIEQRCHDSSEGKYIGMGTLERYDVLRWARFAAEKTPDLPVYLCGISMGAASVMMASDLPLPPSVRGIVADCGFSSPQDIVKKIIREETGMPSRLTMQMVNRKMKRCANFRYDEATALYSVKRTKIPILFVHGTADDFVPSYMSELCYDACSSEKELFLVPGAGHGEAFLCDSAGYQQKLLEFFAKHDQ